MPLNFESPIGLRRWDQQHKPWLRHQQEGYDLSLLEDCENAYRFTAVASSPRVSQLVQNFSRYLPEEAFFILEYYPDDALTQRSATTAERPVPEVFYSPYMSTAEIIGLVKPYF